MGKFEGMIKSEIVRLAKREVRKMTVPMGRDLRSLKSRVSQIRKTLLSLERLAADQQKELAKERAPLEVSPAEVKGSRFSPRLIRALRRRLGLTQKEMAVLTGVTVGAVFQWEKGIFEPRGRKKGVLVALRKLGRRDVKKLLEGKKTEKGEKKVSGSKRRRGKNVRRRRRVKGRGVKRR